ncbi:uncharacterized protein LOC118436756 [Folsomia candida]|uniref:uncharacterized protein LOC118436756 n=1 Tax=Folsomia candida TaxID=158441 RepID=UPI001604BEEA|nr:uncharacterized protein LOC118436756 [Folsomia candida]
MRAKSVIIFDPSYYEVNPSMNFLRYVHEMQNPADWPNWKIRYPTLPALGVDQNHQGAKYIIDLNWFLKPSRGHHVTSLTLSGGIYSNYEYWLKLKPVIQFSDTLEELNLKFSFIFFDMDSIERKFSGWGPISLPKLKRFTLNLAPCHDARPLSFENLSTVWMKNWADAIKGVGYVATFRRASLGSRLVQEMRRNISSGAYQNLREIVLTCKPEDGVNFLTEFNQPLKKVTLTIPLEIRHLREFENSIRKFANSLELLSLRVSTDDLEAEVRFVLNLPCFPNLKTLDFHFGEFENVGWYQGGNDGRSRVGHVARIRLAFPPVRRGDDLGVKYDLHLPSIRSIIIKPLFDDHDDDADNFWNTYADLMDSLLPKEGEGQSCKTLWNLEFPSLDDLEVETRYRQAHRLPEIFPHVRNEWMNRLREMRNN